VDLNFRGREYRNTAAGLPLDMSSALNINNFNIQGATHEGRSYFYLIFNVL